MPSLILPALSGEAGGWGEAHFSGQVSEAQKDGVTCPGMTLALRVPGPGQGFYLCLKVIKLGGKCRFASEELDTKALCQSTPVSLTTSP